MGVNGYQDEEEQEIPTLHVDYEAERAQIERCKAFKASRNKAEWEKACKAVRTACQENRNVMPDLIEAVQVGVTLGEVSDIYRDVFGVYQDPGTI